MLEETIMSCTEVSAGNLSGSSKKIIVRRKEPNRKEPNMCQPFYHYANHLSLMGVYNTNNSYNDA
jgi:hypothetical protein